MRILLLATLWVAPLASAAQTFSPVVEAAVELGGDDVVELFFEDGESQTLTAGQGGTVAGGVLLRPSAASPLGLRATAGVKVLFNASSNASTKILRFPVEVVGTYRVGPGVEVGAGPVAHLGTRLDGDDFVPNVSFDPALGVTIEAGYEWVYLSYTLIEYTAEDGTTFDASNGGLAVRFAF